MNTQARAQAGEPNYELHTLGWKAFQDLCATILAEVMGQTIEQFLPTHDGGRDGAFFGAWSNLTPGGEKGSYTVQCKHTSVPSNALSLGDLADEIEKAKRLAEKGLADNYLLMTNCAVSGTAEENIREAFSAVPGIKWFGLYGSTWINARIRESPRLRMLVPRVYGLGDLSQILDERAYEQARAILDVLGPDLRKFVTTDAHNKAANALLSYGFVILLGEPASGKSMIAATLALGAIDVWNCQAMKLTEPRDLQQHWNPHEPRQFLWFDDAFGATQYQRANVLSWNRLFPHMVAAIHAGARIVFTSRDYIYKAAQNDVKLSAFPLLKESQVVVNVHHLLLSEKQQMVYNHMKLGDQPPLFKSQIKPFLDDVSSSHYFLPEIARRLGTRMFTRDFRFTSGHITAFVEKPLDYLTDMLSSLDVDSKAAIGLLFMNGGSLLHPLSLSSAEQNALQLLGSSETDVRQVLPTLDGDILRLVRSEPSRWTYKHPTINDAYARLLSQNPELIDVYLSGVTPNKLMREITCGDVGVQGAVIIPHSRYDQIAATLSGVSDSDAFFVFLAYRCDKTFLEKYISEHDGLIDSLLDFGSYMGAVREVSVITRLQELKLLPEYARKRFVARAADLAIETPDSDFIAIPRIQAVFTEQELSSILASVKDDLVPDIDSTLQNWRFNYDSSYEPDSYYEPLKDALQTYHDQFEDEEEVQDLLTSALSDIESEVDELMRERENPYEDEDEYQSSSSSSVDEAERSIFDDVDE
jgi:DNA-binding ferritin-like protein (Dps family)